MSKTILVTGGAGFIGSNFIHWVRKKHPDYRILVLDTLTYAASVDNLPQDAMQATDGPIRFWYGNICNAELVGELVSQSDVVVHFAAETHVTRSIHDNLTFFQTDVIGTHTIVNAILKAGGRVERFIHVSTSEVYGTALAPMIDEEHPLNPMSPYASAKCGADRLVYSYFATYGLPLVIVRPFNNFGPRQHLEKLVARFVTSVLLDEPLTVHGDGSAARDFVYAEDTCRAIDLLLHAPVQKVMGQAFNIASGQHRSVLDIAHDIVRMMGYDPSRIAFIGDRPGQVIRHTGDYGKINRLLDWTPRYSWEDGIRATVAWYQANPDWWKRQLWMRHIPILTASGKEELH